MMKHIFRKEAASAAFLFALLGSARSDTLMPVWQNDTATNTLSFNDSFGHNVAVGTYNSVTGIFALTPGSISVGASFTGGLVAIAGSPVTGTGTLAFTVAGTSGGIPYFSSATTWGSSALLATNQIVLGGGAAAAPATLGSLGTTTQFLHGNAAGAPSFGAIVSGDLTTALASPPSIGTTTPGLGVFTGITDGSAAAAGVVGELKSASVAVGSAVSLVTATAKDITTLSLTAGVWWCTGAAATNPAATTPTQVSAGSIGTVANTMSTADSGDPIGGSASTVANTPTNFGLSSGEFNVASTTTIHLVMRVSFTTSTMSGYGSILCRRAR